MIWRVYNTLQPAAVSLDSLPPLAELPDRAGGMAVAVTSDQLVGRTVDWKGQRFQITEATLAGWVERQLPPSGVPQGYDASVLDWRREGNLYLNEPETEHSWPGYASPTPGARRPLWFDPRTGKLAYPFLTPHLGKRPPFAPNHGPAPFLEPIQQGTDAARSGENGPWSLCPAGARQQAFVIHAITLPITLSPSANIVDPVGQLFVLKEEEDAVRADNGRRVPLAIRANAGEDCVDVVFKSELADSRDNGFLSKANIHIHFTQFDIQAGVGMDQDGSFEIKRIKEISDETLVFDQPLLYQHASGEIVSAEFVRYRWYPDVQFGTAYFHDHVDALHSWRHGLFGALIAEPPGSSYHHPHTGADLRSGPAADIHTSAVVSADVTGGFREAVMFIQDGNPLTRVGDSSGSSLTLRVEPLRARGADPSQLFSSQVHGDPATPIIEAFVGDPIVIRALVGGTNDVHTWHIDGHWFRIELFSLTSPPVNTVHLGISERYDLVIPRAGGPQGQPGDYLYYNGRIFKLREGSWGIVRVHGDPETSLRRLPGREPAPSRAEVCPPEAPRRQSPWRPSKPPCLCCGERQENSTFSTRTASWSPPAPDPSSRWFSMRMWATALSSGWPTTQGRDRFRSTRTCWPTIPKRRRAWRWASAPLRPSGPARLEPTPTTPTRSGETVAMIRDWGNVQENPGLGLYGAIIVGPPGARYTHPVTGEDMGDGASWRVDVHLPSAPSYRDFALFIQDEDPIIGTAVMPYAEGVQGIVGVNYQAEPLKKGRVQSRERATTMFPSPLRGEPATPILEAYPGEAVKSRVLVPHSEQAHVFTIEGHEWPFEPGRAGTDLLSSVQVGGLEAITTVPVGGAGGPARLPGDYLYGDHREPYREAGLWGIFRVHSQRSPETGLLPLPER